MRVLSPRHARERTRLGDKNLGLSRPDVRRGGSASAARGAGCGFYCGGFFVFIFKGLIWYSFKQYYIYLFRLRNFIGFLYGFDVGN
jgi:hypothetical protein